MADGFRVSIADLQLLIGQFEIAVASGKIKRSTAPDRNHYPLGQVIAFLRDQPKPCNVSQTWEIAVEICPKLVEFLGPASYNQNTAKLPSGRGITSISFMAVFYLAVALSAAFPKRAAKDLIAANSQIMENSFEIDGRIPVINGYVYVLRDTGNRIIKLGFTSDPDARLSQHRSSNPFLIPIALFPVNSQICETVAHDLLKPYRVTGTREWYYDKPEVIEAISKLFFI